MKELTKKILESGLVDEATAQLMEHWGVLPEGAAELAKNPKLKDATRDQLMKFGEELGEALDRERRLRETMLDLNQLRWPAKVNIIDTTQQPPAVRAQGVDAVIDRMGRYYFRPADVHKNWFVPGFQIIRETLHLSGDTPPETILEVSELFVGDQVAAIQVSTK